MAGDRDKFNVVLDLRCLQDSNYARRGVGRHALALLRQAPADFRLVGLVDETLPALLPKAREAVAAVCPNAYAASGSGTPESPPTGVVMLSPMTHAPLFVARLLSDSALLRAAVVYDFIPDHLSDRYLPGPASRVGYALALRWLARCDVFLPISHTSANDLVSLLGVTESRIAVTGCPLAPAFEGTVVHRKPPRHLLVVGGADARKNPEVVIRAHAGCPAMQCGAGIPLVIAGNYGESDASSFRALAKATAGRADLIEVSGHVSDNRLADLYSQAFALVCPSRDEGFSIPAIEGMAAGVPCLASDIPAHAELVTDPDSRFFADDHAALRVKLERALADADWRATTLARQAEVWPRFRADAVAERFWGALRQRLTHGAPAVLRARRPRVALLSPVPPERSGVADYTAATCAELGQLIDLHVFTETERPAPLRQVSSIRPLGALPHLHAGFDRVISVVGNSHFHTRIFGMLRDYGGACVAHDARMLGFYYTFLGRGRALATAAKELGRTVTETELDTWLSDESKLEALFLGEVAESATPTIVHSRVTAQMFHGRYGVTPAYLPFSIYRPWQAEQLTPQCRAAARARLGLSPAEVAIVTFGIVHDIKAPEACVWALDILRGWGLPVSLHFAGGLSDRLAPGLRPLVTQLGLDQAVRFASDFIPEQTYRDYLVGSDLAIQLRTYGLGQMSGAVLDCAAAGLPTVTNESLASAVGVPSYVRAIPDAISPVLLAQSLAELLDSGLAATRPEAERGAYSEERSIRSYARNLCHRLTIDVIPTMRSLSEVPQEITVTA